MDSSLCDEIKIEILSRTSLKTLDAMRCTSQKIQKITYEGCFLDLYMQRKNSVSGFLVENISHLNYINEFSPSHGSNNIDLGFLPRKARILASSEQGIMVFETPHPINYRWISYHVCKPATKQVLPLPNPRTKYLTEKVAIAVVGSTPLHYKILRLSQPVNSILRSKKLDKSYNTYRCEIFDSTTWAWRQMDLLMLPEYVFLTNPQPITTRGSIYMLLTNNDIVKFDVYSEKWTIFSSPTLTRDYGLDASRQLVKHEGKLGFVCMTPKGSWEIWIFEIGESWEKIFGFNEEEDDNLRKSDDSYGFMMDDNNTLRFYRENTINEVVLTDRFYRMFVYRSDFEPTSLSVDTSR